MLIGRAQKRKKAAHGDLLLCDPDALRGNYMARQPQGLFSNAIRHNMKGAQGYAVPHGLGYEPAMPERLWDCVEPETKNPAGRQGWIRMGYLVCSMPTMREIIIHFRTKASYLLLTCCDNSLIAVKVELPVTILKMVSAWLSSASSLATSDSKKGFQLRVHVRT